MLVQEIKASIKQIEEANKLSSLSKIAGEDREPDFIDIDLSNEDLSDADLSGMNLRAADLKDANFSGAYLEEAILGQSVARSALLSIIKEAFERFVQISIKDRFSKIETAPSCPLNN